MEPEINPHEANLEEEQEVEERVRRANAQAARYRIERNTARQELATLQSQFAAAQGNMAEEIATLSQRIDEATAQIEAEQHQRWRVEAVARVGLPPELAERLQGASPDALLEDASRLAQLFPVRKNPRTHAAHAPAVAPPTRAQQIVNRIEGRQGNPFDILLQKGLGGGAIHED